MERDKEHRKQDSKTEDSSSHKRIPIDCIGDDTSPTWMYEEKLEKDEAMRTSEKRE